MVINQFRTLLVCMVVFMFGGCVMTPEYDEQSDYDFDSYSGYAEEQTADPNKIKHRIGNKAVKDLWDSAEAARNAGDYETAILLLERALRIVPNDAVMWSRLAEIHLRQGNSNQAENLAAKSNAMTVDNPTLNYRNWLIISRARSQRGDDIGAQEAEYTAASFRL